MKQLDLDGVTIYTEDDVIDAMGLIGQDVYLSNYKDFSVYSKNEFIGINYVIDNSFSTLYPFICKGKDGNERSSYRYLILAKDVKFKEEKKLRPFKTIEEFEETTDFKVGDVIKIKRFADLEEYEETCVFSGYRTKTNQDPQITTVTFGSNSYTFDELKNFFNYCIGDDLYPFGVLE